MKLAAVSDLKNRLSHYLRLVARGESVTVLDRGRPVARLTRVEGDDAELEALVAAGLARPPLSPLPKDFLTRPLPRPKRSVQEALIDDRADAWTEVAALGPVRDRALRLVATHPLRAADAMQLGAALVGVADSPTGETTSGDGRGAGQNADR